MVIKTEPTSNNTQHRQHVVASPRPEIKNLHPPSYNSLYPSKAAPHPPSPVSNQRNEETEESLQKLRRRNLTLALEPPPPPKPTSREAAEAAARTAMRGVGIGLNHCHQHPELLAAHTARAIAIAVSTSGSHTALLAAAHAVEAGALIAHETRHDKDKKEGIERTRNAVQAAVEFAMAAEADHAASGSWNSNTKDANHMHAANCTGGQCFLSRQC